MAKRDAKELRETRLLDPEVFTAKTEINIYGHKMMALSLEEGEQIAIILESSILVESFRQMFEMLWRGVAQK